jgi:positive regulator of sigma E activity
MRSGFGFEWIPGGVFFGMVLLVLIVPSFALIGLAVVALAAVAAVVALAGAVLATPYLLVRTVRRHLAERHAWDSVAAAHPAETVGVDYTPVSAGRAA